MVSRVHELYCAWFDVFNDTRLPQLISQTAPKWYHHDRDLALGDVVYFRKTEGPIKGPWTMGMVPVHQSLGQIILDDPAPVPLLSAMRYFFFV